ncbi:hypothetical protein VTL71DRAFT_9980 [Oculimacula yallundae]|uniref:Uncharacterized protein n=1 Tax=Oculimacula yallundae TaxID=86028 RepID=A0ABR4BPZ6_9HELO
MQFTAFCVTALLAAVASARDFTIYEHQNMQGNAHRETRWDDDACWNMNGAGDQASSVAGQGCTAFYSGRDCTGGQWLNYGDATTVPGFLENHIVSFRNKCPSLACPDPFDVCTYTNTDGECETGYGACLQKMGCDGRSGDADCIGIAIGCRTCA